jgi:hypothetical protein
MIAIPGGVQVWLTTGTVVAHKLLPSREDITR